METIFEPEIQMDVVNQYDHYVEAMCWTRTIEQWNERREFIKKELRFQPVKLMMLLGYIDATLRPWIRKQ